MTEKQDIVILGASWAGLAAAHYSLRHVLPKLPDNGSAFRVVLVAPSEHFYYRIAAPRAVIAPELMPTSKIFLPIAENFAQYDKSKFSFVLGTATEMDVTARTVTIATPDSEKPQKLVYHALIIATGTSMPAKALSLSPTADATKAALADTHSHLHKAKTIIIAGGGPSGVETAGEVGEALNGAAGWFKARPANPKARITLLSGSDRLLSVLRPALSNQAEVFLARVGVDVVHGKRVTSTAANADGSVTVNLDDGSAMTADVYIPATGAIPNTTFVPAALLDDKGYVNASTSTRVENAGPRVFVVGDVASYATRGLMEIMKAVPAAMTNLTRDLLAHVDGKDVAPGADRTFKTLEGVELQLVPIGRSKGVGAIFGYRVPSFLVWLIKGRDYVLFNAKLTVQGKQWSRESKWTAPKATDVVA